MVHSSLCVVEKLTRQPRRYDLVMYSRTEEDGQAYQFLTFLPRFRYGFVQIQTDLLFSYQSPGDLGKKLVSDFVPFSLSTFSVSKTLDSGTGKVLEGL